MDRAERLRTWDALERPLILPSLLDCDFARIGEVLAAMEWAGVRAVHLDVMDGHFVPNLSYGAPVIRDWRKRTGLTFDAHLMMDDPGRYLDDFVAAGCDLILVHIEVLPDPIPLLRRIRGSGCRAGLVLNPPTPVDRVLPHLGEVDRILVMSVMPGRGGQAFQPVALEHVRAIRAARPGLPVAIDGGIKPHNAAEVVTAGASELVVGSFMYRPDGDFGRALSEVSESARRGRAAP